MAIDSTPTKRILITSGPTWVPIDAMRVISNRSSGKMGRLLAAQCAATGAEVTLLEGPVSSVNLPHLENTSGRHERFTYFNDLKQQLKTELLNTAYDIVIHAAAVSDFQVTQPATGKIDSRTSALTLTLMPTEKLIESIKTWAPQTKLIGFKFEPNMDIMMALNKTKNLFKKAHCDLAIANSLDAYDHYTGYLLNAQGQCLTQSHSRDHMVNALINTLGLTS